MKKSEMTAYMEREEIALAGTVQDFTDPSSGVNCMLFPVSRSKPPE